MIDVLKQLIKQFMPFAQQKMGFSRPPKLFLRDDPQNAANPLGKTGFYDPQAEAITLYTTGRHPKDIMRSLAHELQHHTQKCNGDFEKVQNMGEEGYAQTDPHMRTMEIQAYQASIVFRDWEDSCKGTIYYEHLQKGDKSSMSTKKWKNGELKSLLSEAWGFKMDLSKLNEGTYDNDEELEEAFGKQDTGRARRKPHGAGEREKQEDCDARTDPTCVPEPGDEAVEKSIASRMNEKKKGKYDDGDGEDERCDHVPCKGQEETIDEEEAPGKRDMENYKSAYNEDKLKEMIVKALREAINKKGK
jgi:hypothetical protein